MLLKDMANKNKTESEDIKLSTMKEKLERAIDAMISYRIKEDDPFYITFNENMKKKLALDIYLTKVVTIINKLTTALDNLTVADIIKAEDEDIKSLQTELSITQRNFKRRPSEAIDFHFDIITDVIWTNSNDYKFVDALKDACERLKNKDKSKDILVELDRVKAQVCAKKYEVFYSAVENITNDGYGSARNSLLKVIEILKFENDNFTDISTFFKARYLN